MYSRIRIAFGLALLLALITSVTVFAKGGFSFINITGPYLKDAVRVTDPALTTDFFAFADFNKDRVEAPDDPGVGYEITRYIVDHYVTGQREVAYVAWQREVAFDRLHYYPDTGFVYYDGKWYTAKPEIKTIFESALSLTPITQKQSFKSIDQIQSGVSVAQPQSAMPIAVTAGLAIILVLAFWLAGNWYFKLRPKKAGVSDQSLENPLQGG